MKKLTAVLLFALIAISVSVMWVTSKWATSIPETGAFFLVALWAIAFLRRAETPRFSTIMIPLCGVILWAIAQAATGLTVYHEATWLSILYWSGNLAVVFVCVQSFTDSDLRRRFFRWLTVFGFIVSVIAALQALTNSTKIYWVFSTEFEGWNLLGPFVYHNQFAAFIELLLPIALYNALTEEKWRIFDILIAATMYAAVIVSTSRTGFILVTGELILVPLIVVGRRGLASRQTLGAAGLLIGMVLFLAVAAGPDILLGRFGVRDPYSGRREFVYSSLTMFRQNPITGVGLGNWSTAYPRYALYDDGKFANEAHNDWAQWAVEGGVPLLLLQLWIAAWVFPRAVRSPWALGTATILLHAFVDYPIRRPAGSLVFFAILGAVASASANSSKDESGSADGQPRRLRLVRP